MKVIKRNGSEVIFDITKIIIAVTHANESVPEAHRMTPVQIRRIAQSVELHCQQLGRSPTVEQIQDLVEHQIMAHGAFEVAKSYITYRYTRSLVRKSNTADDKILALIECGSEDAGPETDGRKSVVNAAQRNYIAGEVSRDITCRLLLPREVAEAHNEGLIHFHDTDHFAQRMHGDCLINLEDMLQNGTVLSGTLIERPHSFATACSIATQIVAQVAGSQYGGQTITLAHLAPFVQISRDRLRSSVRNEFDNAGIFVDNEKVNAIAEKRLREEIRRGVQTIQYQTATLPTAGGQAPDVTVFMYLGEARDPRERADLALIIEEMLLQRLQGVKGADGRWFAPEYPKLVYVLEENNIRPDGPYSYLTRLAARCSARRMAPDYISEKLMREQRTDKTGRGHCCPPAGSGTFLPPYWDENDEPRYYGRFSLGMVTLNLPDAALSADGNIETFWKLLDERLELCHRALLCRLQRLKGTLSDAAPILWQHGACARLRKGQSIDMLLYGGYSAVYLGYAGLCECVRAMTGKSHADPSATPFALEIVSRMNDACRRWTSQHNVAFSLCGTLPVSTGRKFARCLRKRFGAVEGVTDGQQITESFHPGADEAMDSLRKVEFEAQFQRLSPGGGITRVGMPDLPEGSEELPALLPFLYEHSLCAGPDHTGS